MISRSTRDTQRFDSPGSIIRRALTKRYRNSVARTFVLFVFLTFHRSVVSIKKRPGGSLEGRRSRGSFDILRREREQVNNATREAVVVAILEKHKASLSSSLPAVGIYMAYSRNSRGYEGP